MIASACAGCYVNHFSGPRPGDWQDSGAVPTSGRESVAPSDHANDLSRLPLSPPVAVLREAEPIPPAGPVPSLGSPAPVPFSVPPSSGVSNRAILPTAQWISLTRWAENNGIPA